MKIRKDDTIKMLLGKDRGKTGKILRVFSKENKVLVEGLNLVKKAVRARKQGQKGQIVSKPRPVDVSNLMLICPVCGKASRVGFSFEGGKKVRICKRCRGTF